MRINLMTLFISIRWIDVIDVLLVALLIYQLYYLLKGSVAINILVGIILFYVLWLVVNALDMQLFGSILGKFIDVGFIALLIVFQQEIRRFLLFIGTNDLLRKGKFSKMIFDFKWQTSQEKNVDIKSIVDACEQMSTSKTGALIIMAKNNDLKYYTNSGDLIEAKVSPRMIENIFFKNSPLHDGAIIIANNVITGARCVLPVTNTDNFPAHLGMRHRAALGITENTDAIAIVVSEQTGGISFANAGELTTNLSSKELSNLIKKTFKVSA